MALRMGYAGCSGKGTETEGAFIPSADSDLSFRLLPSTSGAHPPPTSYKLHVGTISHPITPIDKRQDILIGSFREICDENPVLT